MKVLLAILVAAAFAGCSKETPDRLDDRRTVTDIPCTNIGSSVRITGYLGLPVGQTVTIRGTKFDGKLHSVFHVGTVDGAALVRPITLSIEGIAHWTNGTPATITGCERGTLYSDLRLFNHGIGDTRYEGPGQYLLMSFKVARIEEPKGLTIKQE